MSTTTGKTSTKKSSTELRFGDYQRKLGTAFDTISMNRFYKHLETDDQGNLIPRKRIPFTLTPTEKYRLLFPYLSVRFKEQFKAVVPLAVYLLLFQIIILKQWSADYVSLVGGLFAVIIGLMFFLEGLKLGLMPFGTVIGATLPRKLSLPLVLFITTLLGIGVTFAEPAIGALKAAGQNVSVEQAPYLYAILNDWSDVLVLVVGASVGLAAVMGTLRFVYGWSLKPLIYMALIPVLGLTLMAWADPKLQNIIGLAWDCGAVTTGPVTVPLVLSLGIGIATSAGKGDSELSGFGIVTLASLFPVIGVFLLGLYLSVNLSADEIIAAAKAAESATHTLSIPWYERSPYQEIVLGVRAIVPLVLFLFFIYTVVLKATLHNKGVFIIGILLTIIGMCIFNIGLTYGLSNLGGSIGNIIPAAFIAIPEMAESPIYKYAVGVTLTLFFAWALGYGATIAEPALNALGETTENLTNGVFKKSTLLKAVAIGVAFGIAAGVAQLVFHFPLIWLLVPGYLFAMLLTFFSNEQFVNVAWDSAGVTTGPITVPLVLAMGLGIGEAMNAAEGFGILCLASIGPIISVMITGLWARYQEKRQILAVTLDAEQATI
jgi:hypothetical protein